MTELSPVSSASPWTISPPSRMDAKKIIARRAAMELPQDAIVNLGTGAPEKIANVGR